MASPSRSVAPSQASLLAVCARRRSPLPHVSSARAHVSFPSPSVSAAYRRSWSAAGSLMRSVSEPQAAAGAMQARWTQCAPCVRPCATPLRRRPCISRDALRTDSTTLAASTRGIQRAGCSSSSPVSHRLPFRSHQRRRLATRLVISAVCAAHAHGLGHSACRKVCMLVLPFLPQRGRRGRCRSQSRSPASPASGQPSVRRKSTCGNAQTASSGPTPSSAADLHSAPPPSK